MKIITLKSVKSAKSPGKKAGAVVNGIPVGTKPFVYPDGLSAQFLTSKKWSHLIHNVEELKPHLRLYKGQDLNGKSILIWRTGGFGDVLFLTPLIHHLKKKFPTCKIQFGTQTRYRMIFHRNPDVECVYSVPMPFSAVQQTDYHLHFEGTIEASTNPTLHAVDLFARHAGIELSSEEKLPIYKPNTRQIQKNRIQLMNMGIAQDRPWVAVQCRTSSPIRSYPAHLLKKVIKKLEKAGLAVLVLGMAGDCPKMGRRSGIYDLTGRYKDMSDTVAVLSLCNVLVAPDSALTHFAGAMGIPTVAIYGPFPGKIRTAYYPGCETLEVDYPCAPCMLHGQEPCPKSKEGWSPCFETIRTETIVDSVKKVINQKSLANENILSLSRKTPFEATQNEIGVWQTKRK